MAKTSWRDELWRFYEGIFGQNYRTFIHKFSNKESEVVVSFHVKGNELVVTASPSTLQVIKHGHMETGHPEELFKSRFSKTELKKIAPLIKDAEPR